MQKNLVYTKGKTQWMQSAKFPKSVIFAWTAFSWQAKHNITVATGNSSGQGRDMSRVVTEPNTNF